MAVVAGAPAGSPVMAPVGAPAASVSPVTPSVSNNKSPAAQSVPSPVPTSGNIYKYICIYFVND